jgi:CRP/FNR family transcriptional regulator, dissimilatory nitrate respiration regulator
MDPGVWSILQSTAFFKAMSAEDAITLTGNRPAQTYEKGTTLFRQGDPASAFFVVVSGWVKLYRVTPDGLEVVINVFAAGDTFAEAVMFSGGRYPACAETVSRSRLLRIESSVFRARILEKPELALSMLASASRHLKSLIGQIEQIKVRSAPQRVAEFLLAALPQGERGPAEIEFPFEKALLANRLGMKPESFSRALGKLKPYGVVVDRETVVVEDPVRLHSFVNYSAEDDDV